MVVASLDMVRRIFPLSSRKCVSPAVSWGEHHNQRFSGFLSSEVSNTQKAVVLTTISEFPPSNNIFVDNASITPSWLSSWSRYAIKPDQSWMWLNHFSNWMIYNNEKGTDLNKESLDTRRPLGLKPEWMYQNWGIHWRVSSNGWKSLCT